MADGTGALRQFVGATITHVRMLRGGGFDGQEMLSFGMSARLPDGSERDLEIYTLETPAMHVRVDGMYVPPEELP